MVTFPIFWIFWMSKFEFEENAAVRWLYVYDRWFEISSRMNDSYVESSIKHDYAPSVVIKFWRVMNKRPGRSRGCLSHRPINSVVAAICWHKNQTLFFSLRSWSLRLMLHFWFTASSTFLLHGGIGLEPYRNEFWFRFFKRTWDNKSDTPEPTGLTFKNFRTKMHKLDETWTLLGPWTTGTFDFFRVFFRFFRVFRIFSDFSVFSDFFGFFSFFGIFPDFLGGLREFDEWKRI